MVKTKKNKDVRDELKALKDIERRQSILEKERRRIESHLVSEAGGPRKAFAKKQTRAGLSDYVLKRLRRRRFLHFWLTTMAAVMIWAGLWTLIEHYIPSPWISLAGGLLIIWLLQHFSA